MRPDIRILLYALWTLQEVRIVPYEPKPKYEKRNPGNKTEPPQRLKHGLTVLQCATVSNTLLPGVLQSF